MRAQVSLIPNESKKLIAKAVAKMDEVKNALERGTVALHPSSSTIFIVEELIGELPATEVWVCGVVVPKAACRSAELMLQYIQDTAEGRAQSPAQFPHTWVIEKGELKTGMLLGDIVDQMGPDDVYIKGVNAVDPDNNVGVLIGNLMEGGTIGLVMSRARHRGFKLLYPVGLEKLIPISMKQASQEAAHRKSLYYSMGMPCALLPCEGIVVTEPRAIEVLTGATAVPIGAGGLGGAEGAITMIIKGDDEQVPKAINYIETVKGAQIPRDLGIANCQECAMESCSLGRGDKPWS